MQYKQVKRLYEKIWLFLNSTKLSLKQREFIMSTVYYGESYLKLNDLYTRYYELAEKIKMDENRVYCHD